MKTDHEVRRMRNERHKGKTQEQAAARAQMSVRTARKYERLAQLPSQLKKPRARTRPNPFAQDWPWVSGLTTSRTEKAHNIANRLIDKRLTTSRTD